MRYILALDQGTTSARAIIFDENGSAIGSAQKEFPQIYPKPGWVEHDPEVIWKTQYEMLEEVCTKNNISAHDIAAIGITTQRETTVIWDKNTGKPIYNAIVWQDKRTAPICEDLKNDGLEAYVRKATGLVIDAYLIDRENDVKGGRLRQATFEGYVQHIRRLRPLGAGKIDIDKDGYRFRYYKRAIGRFVWFKASSLNAAQNARDKITEVALHDDPLYAEKEATLAAPLKNLKWEFIQRILDNIERSQNTRQHHFVTFTNIITWSIKKVIYSKLKRISLHRQGPPEALKHKSKSPLKSP